MTHSSESVVHIHGDPWKLADLEDSISDCRALQWEQRAWEPRPALVHRNGGSVSLYHGQKFDPDKIDLVPNAWNHDHCQICWWDLFDSDDVAHSIGYNSGTRWICNECYEKFIAATQ
jgi:hypothetical protein